MGGAGGWLWRPGGPGGFALLFTVAGLTVIAAALIEGIHHLPEPPRRPGSSDPAKRAADALETIAARLKVISEALPGGRNRSVTVRMDEVQWQDIRDAVAGPRESGTGSARHADGIAADVGKAAEIASGVQKLSETTDGIAKSVSHILEEAERIEAGIRGMTGPWGCVSPSCLGTVRFPHNEPTPSGESSEARVDAECSNLWTEDIPTPTKEDLADIVKELKRHDPSSIWILGHASTLGSKRRNDALSLRRARFVECRLKDLKDTLGEPLRLSIKTCAAGEEASTNSLRYPDFRYRLVQVLSGQPPDFLECVSG